MDALREAAQSVLDRWDSPQWEWAKNGPTADLMHALRAALAQPSALDAQPVAWMDDFGNVFPLAANKGAGSWMDDHKRNWKPLYAAAQPAQPAPQPLTGELPDSIRVPLHRLWADAGYLIGRARTGDVDLAVHTIKSLCDEVERAIRAAGITAAPTTDKGQG